MKFSQEDLTESLLEEVKPLLLKHWQEISFYKDIPLDPDYDLYLRMQHNGNLKCFSCREDSGNLIGYAVYLVQPNPHYKGSIWAKEDILFVDPSKRGMGMFLLKYCDEQLLKMNVQVVTHHIKFSHDWSNAAVLIGYEKNEIMVSRRLDK